MVIAATHGGSSKSVREAVFWIVTQGVMDISPLAGRDWTSERAKSIDEARCALRDLHPLFPRPLVTSPPALSPPPSYIPPFIFLTTQVLCHPLHLPLTFPVTHRSSRPLFSPQTTPLPLFPPPIFSRFPTFPSLTFPTTHFYQHPLSSTLSPSTHLSHHPLSHPTLSFPPPLFPPSTSTTDHFHLPTPIFLTTHLYACKTLAFYLPFGRRDSIFLPLPSFIAAFLLI